MAAHFGRIEGLVVVLAFVLGALSVAPLAESQDSARSGARRLPMS